MSDFVTRPVKVFDALTVTVLLAQGDIDYTMVEYWDCTNAYRPEQPGVNQGWQYAWQNAEPDWRRRGPVQLTCCLACLCKRHGRFSDAEDNKSQLLEAVKRGDVNITRVWLRTALTHCSSCGALPHKALNPNWLDFLT